VQKTTTVVDLVCKRVNRELRPYYYLMVSGSICNSKIRAQIKLFFNTHDVF